MREGGEKKIVKNKCAFILSGGDSGQDFGMGCGGRGERGGGRGVCGGGVAE